MDIKYEFVFSFYCLMFIIKEYKNKNKKIILYNKNY